MFPTLLMLSLSACDLQHEVSARVGKRVDVRVEDGLLHVRLLDRVRVVPASGSCEGDLEVAVVVARTWVQEPAAPPPPPPRPAPPPAPRARLVMVASSPPELAPVVEPEPVLVAVEYGEPVDAPQPVAEAEQHLEPAPVQTATAVSLSAAARATFGAGFAPGVAVGVDVGQRWAFRAELLFDAERTAEIALGRVHWWRAAANAGLRVRFAFDAWFLEPSLSLAAAAVVLRSSGFEADGRGATFSAGACTSLRAGRGLTGGISAFAALGGCAWTSSRLVVSGAGSAELPIAEATLSLGLSWSVR